MNLHLSTIIFWKTRVLFLDELLDLMQLEHGLPLLNCERGFCQHISHLLICTDKFHPNSRVHSYSFYQPIQVDAMSPGNVPKYRATTF